MGVAAKSVAAKEFIAKCITNSFAVGVSGGVQFQLALGEWGRTRAVLRR